MNLISKYNLDEKWEDFMDLIWYNRVSWVTSKFQMLSRMIFWGWYMRNSYDFDAHTIYDMLEMKLDRLYYVFKHHSHCVWNSDVENKDMRRLCEARGLAHKLAKGDYMRHYTKITKTYRVSYDKNDISIRIGIRYPSENKLISNDYYRKLSKRAWNLDEAERKTDQDRLFFLLNTRINHWWD